MSNLLEAIQEDNILKLKQAIKEGADLNQMVEIGEDDEQVLLFYALRHKVSCEMIALLIAHGADINYTTDDGVSLVDEAVMCGDLELLTYLKNEHNLEINQTQRKSGFTPFMQSCCYGRMDVAKFLVECGADIHIKDNMGMCALDYTKRMRQKKMQEYIESLAAKS